METHQRVAIGIFLGVALLVLVRDGTGEAVWTQLLAPLILLVAILGYRLIVFFAGFGIPAIFASDRDSARPEPFAVLFWILYLLVCVALVAGWTG